MAKEFDYKQRPFASHVTDADYDVATGRAPRASVPEVAPPLDVTNMTRENIAEVFSIPPELVGSRPYQVPVIHPAGQPCGTCGVKAEHVHVGRTL